MGQPKISVIVPVYNVEQYLCQCIDSILSQNYRDFELLLINDGSKDDSGKICDKYADIDSCVKVFHKSNGGVSSARNMGLKYACGDYVTFVDGDDMLVEQDMLFQLYHLYLNEKKYEIIEFPGLYFAGNKEKEYLNRIRCNLELSKPVSLFNYWFANPRFEVWGHLYKRSLLQGIYFEEMLTVGEDVVFLMEALQRCKSYLVVKEGCYYYRYRETSVMHQKKTVDYNLFILQTINKKSKIVDRTFFLNLFYRIIMPQMLAGKLNEKTYLSYATVLDEVSLYDILYSDSPSKVKCVLFLLKLVGFKMMDSIIKTSKPLFYRSLLVCALSILF